MCEIHWCRTKKRGTIPVHENIGDGSWRVLICKDCQKRIGVERNGNLPQAYIVKERLRVKITDRMVMDIAGELNVPLQTTGPRRKLLKWKVVDNILDEVDRAVEAGVKLPKHVIDFYNEAIGEIPIYQRMTGYPKE